MTESGRRRGLRSTHSEPAVTESSSLVIRHWHGHGHVKLSESLLSDRSNIKLTYFKLLHVTISGCSSSTFTATTRVMSSRPPEARARLPRGLVKGSPAGQRAGAAVAWYQWH